MKIRGIDFGSVMCASGARNFFGEGWDFHRWFRRLGLDFAGSTLVTKTVTLEPRAGNMPLQGTQPADRRPACVKPYVWRGNVLNAVGLTNLGLPCSLADGRWQRWPDPFLISYMCVGQTPGQRTDEARVAAEHLVRWKHRFRAPFGLEVNLSCPNVGHDQQDLLKDALAVIDALEFVEVPIVVKLNALVRVDTARCLMAMDAVDAVTVSNTIPFGTEGIDWRRHFGACVSPLEERGFGPGGASGSCLFPIVRDWFERAVMAKWPPGKHLIACGGIMGGRQAVALLKLGASAVQLGTVCMLRPWRVRGIIRAVNRHMETRKEDWNDD